MIEIGTMLNNRYELVKQIGSGGMADVFRGKDYKLRRYVAIKILKREFAEDESFVKKFQIEAQAAAGIMHPNIVNVYDVGEDSGLNYMVMELVNGITLKEYIEKKERISDSEAISIVIQMAMGLGEAHRKQLVHRDVKPQNVMISNDGKVKVTDFGIAKPTTSNTISTNVMGSVHYTSPEQARGSACDVQSDIYSTGITLYEMVTGTVPFDGETTVAIAVKHLQEDILPPSEYVPDMYESLEQIILKCTQKNPSRRYANMDELIKDLKQSLADPDGDFVHTSGPLSTYAKVDEDEDEYEDEEYDGEEGAEDVDPKMKKVVKVLTIVAGVLVVAFIAFLAYTAFDFFGNGPAEQQEENSDKIEVPDIVGLTEEEALEKLNELGLGLNAVAREESPKYEEGQIISQEIEAGEMVDKNTSIKVVVSSGIAEKTVVIPSITGMSEDEGQKELNDLGLKVDATSEFSDSVEQGDIISVNPAEGTEVAEESTVFIVVSKGPEPIEKVSVPQVTGKSLSAAKSELEGVGLAVASSEEYHDSIASGNVISQDISAGKNVDEGTTINLVVSKGPETKYVTVPSMIGKDGTEVKAELESNGLVVTVREESSTSVTKGVVISANVQAGAQVQEGSTVTIVVSSGSNEVEPEPNPDSNTDAENGN